MLFRCLVYLQPNHNQNKEHCSLTLGSVRGLNMASDRKTLGSLKQSEYP